MTPPPAGLPIVALAGNPNSGKTTVFNELTGLRHKVGNYPGITVEKRWGRLDLDGGPATLIDLPGAYSLAPRSRDEAIAFEVLTGRAQEPLPSLTVVVIDAANLDRNLYLTLQILEFGRPVIIALNMIDVAADVGISIDAEKLSERLGVTVVPMIASKGQGADRLKDAISNALSADERTTAPMMFGSHDADALDRISACLPDRTDDGATNQADAAWIVATLATADGRDVLGSLEGPFRDLPDFEPAVVEARAVIESQPDLPGRLVEARYKVARSIREDVLFRTQLMGPTRTDRIDAWLLHPVLGPLVLLSVMALVFQSIFAWAQPLMDVIEATFAALAGAVDLLFAPGPLRDLLVDGVLAGVGSVVVFLPQIAILFLLIALLEDSGYLARAAYIMDRLMSRIGLHGRAVVPLISGFACAVPAVMATRTIESTRDRMVTIMVLPLVTCSARLPIYALIIGTLFSDTEPLLGVIQVGGLLLLLMYLFSILFTLGVAAVLKRTLFKSPTPPLILELPPYRMPALDNVVSRVISRSKVFLRDAGSVILACSIVLWALLSYPRVEPDAAHPARSAALHAAQLSNSYAGRLGHAIEPAIKPLGYDWKIGIGLIGSFAAREVLVATLGQVYGLGRETDENSTSLRQTMRAQRDPATNKAIYTPLSGLSLMVFFLLAAQCMSTLAIVKRETGSWRWPALMFTYMTVLAWLGAFAVYQGGRALGFS